MNLEAVRDALVHDATQAADAVRADADRDAAATVAAARAEAEQLLAEARTAGDAQARSAAAAALTRVRREARGRVLAARRDAYDQATSSVADAAAALRHAAVYPELEDRLAALARLRLGPEAVVTSDPDVGGVVATLGTRSVDLRLPVLARRCLVTLGAGVEQLWD